MRGKVLKDYIHHQHLFLLSLRLFIVLKILSLTQHCFNISVRALYVFSSSRFKRSRISAERWETLPQRPADTLSSCRWFEEVEMARIDWMTRLVSPSFGDSVSTSLFKASSDTNQRSNRAVTQVTESSFSISPVNLANRPYNAPLSSIPSDLKNKSFWHSSSFR